VGFWIHNQTDRGSGSHFVGRFKDHYTDSIEDLVRAGSIQNNDRLADILSQKDKFRVISILSEKSREQTTGLEGGGNMEQTFVWSEKQLDCTMRMLPPAIYWSLLDITDWPDYKSSITQ
jgi:hypothetical protein